MIIDGRVKDLGAGFQVARYLPTGHKRSVGPFIFLDEMGPVESTAQKKLDVRPHPHIGLSTVTYLLSGEGLHRDSLGSEQVIRAGDINLMVAGRGITHSERTRDEFLAQPASSRILHGLQFWMALPKELEQCEPSFTHYSQDLFRSHRICSGVECKVLMGSAFGLTSPVQTFSKTLFLDFSVNTPAEFVCDLGVDEYALIEIESNKALAATTSSMCSSRDAVGPLENLVNDISLQKAQLLYTSGAKLNISTKGPARFLLFGGAVLPEPRFMWWNFVATEKELIREAAHRWKSGQFPRVPGETEFIPLPIDPLP